MSATVIVNGQTVVHKGSGGVLTTSPDVCLTPVGNAVVPITNPVKQVLFGGLSWKDVVFNPKTVVSTVKSLPKAMGDVPGVLGSAIKGFSGAAPGITSMAKGIGKGLALAVASNVVGLFVRDTEWYINRGGYQDRVDGDLKPHREENRAPDHVPAEAVYVITMKTPDGAGDGTVPESSARALDPFASAAVKYDRKGKKIRRTFSIGDVSGAETAFVKKKAPRTKPKSPPEFDEAWFDRGHEPVYKTKSAQHITFTVIESICRRRIAEQKGSK